MKFPNRVFQPVLGPRVFELPHIFFEMRQLGFAGRVDSRPVVIDGDLQRLKPDDVCIVALDLIVRIRAQRIGLQHVITRN